MLLVGMDTPRGRGVTSWSEHSQRMSCCQLEWAHLKDEVSSAGVGTPRGRGVTGWSGHSQKMKCHQLEWALLDDEVLPARGIMYM